MLTPPVVEDDIGQRNTADRPEPAKWGSRSESGHRNARRVATRKRPPLPSQTVSRASSVSAEAERSCCEQHVLNGWVDRRPGSSGRCSAFEARDDPHGSLMDVRRQIFCRVEQPRNRSRLMPGAGSPDRYRGATCSSHARLDKAPTVSLDLWIADYQKAPALHISAARGTDPRLQDLSDQFVRHRVWLTCRIERVV